VRKHNRGTVCPSSSVPFNSHVTVVLLELVFDSWEKHNETMFKNSMKYTSVHSGIHFPEWSLCFWKPQRGLALWL